MKFYYGIIMIVVLLLTGCTNNETAEDIVEETTVKEGKYGLCIHNPKPHEKDAYDTYPVSNEHFRFRVL